MKRRTFIKSSAKKISVIIISLSIIGGFSLIQCSQTTKGNTLDKPLVAKHYYTLARFMHEG